MLTGGASLQPRWSSHLEPDRQACGLDLGLDWGFFTLFPRVVPWLGAVRLTFFLGLFSEPLTGAQLGVAGGERTKISRMLPLSPGRL